MTPTKGREEAAEAVETETNGGSAAPDGLQTLDRALAILNLFQPEHEEWTAAEGARETGLSLATVSRFMRGLETRGFLMRVSRRRYRLGFAAIELGQRALHSVQLRDRLRPVTARLARDSGETAVLLALIENTTEARVIDEARAGPGVRIAVSIGHLLPIDDGLGAVFLASMRPEERQALVTGRITKAAAKSYDEISRRGWTRARVTDACWGVAAPVLTPGGRPIAALGLIAPDSRASEKAERRLVSLLPPAVEEAQKRLGVSPADALED